MFYENVTVFVVKKLKIFAEKFGGKEKMSTFAIPNEKRGTETLQVWFEKFIEKTVLLYKKQVPRNTIYREALILLKGL